MTAAIQASVAAPIISRESCYHCEEPIPRGIQCSAFINGIEHAMCCPGCTAVAELIADCGLDQFYTHRTAASPRPEEFQTDADYPILYDDAELNSGFVTPDATGKTQKYTARLLVSGINCAACTWLIETMLAQQTGVLSATVSMATMSLTLSYDPAIIKLSDLVNLVEDLGYTLRPYRQNALRAELEKHRKRSLRRLGLAGIAMMQVGMMAVALYVGEARGIDTNYRDLMRAVSALFATLVVCYSASGFFSTAWKHLRRGVLVMDLPVAMAIGLAYIASLWATVSGGGVVYFDSVVMFTFFLLVGRFFEERSRQSYALNASSVEDTVPELCSRRTEQGWETTPRLSIQVGDEILVKTGAAIPLDGYLVAGQSNVNQASLDGEHIPRAISVGDYVFAGSINLDGSIEIRVAADSRHTRLAALQDAIDRASVSKPPLARLADRVARHFVALVLLVTTLTALFYASYAPDKIIWVCLSLLVVSCPCALALATPAALTAVTHRLLKAGVIVRSPDALEALAEIDHIFFDKTGTLTEGSFQLSEVITLQDTDKTAVLNLAAGLQAHSNHPIAAACTSDSATPMKECRQIPGAGMSGFLKGMEYRMGSMKFCADLVASMPEAPSMALYWIALCNENEPIAWLGFADKTRPEADSVISALRDRGITPGLITGDSSLAGPRLAGMLQLDRVWHGCTPEQKLQVVNELQQSGAQVAMVGDGLNDAPVLRGAKVSFAMPRAADITNAEADLVLSEDSLAPVVACVDAARQCRRVIKQNLAWALAYNLTAIPLAAAGLVPPWAAAIGMSVSSLAVVTNSLRAGQPHNG